MNRNLDFVAKKISRFRNVKIGKGRFRLGLLLLVVFLGVIAFLSTVEIDDADAGFLVEKGFKKGLAVSQSSLYEGDFFNLTIFLTNNNEQTQFVVFQGACQATYKIFDKNDEVVFPVNPEDTPCNNVGYEEFLIYPGQVKRYYFSHNLPLKAGKYVLKGFIDGFGDTPRQTLVVIERPKITVEEGELCEGLTGKKCDKGLECRFRGGFPDAAGMCFKLSSEFSPRDRCKNKICLSDIDYHKQATVIEKFVNLGYVSGFADGTFRPDDKILTSDFYVLVSKISQKKIAFNIDEKYLNRDVALKILYHSFVSDEKPKRLQESPFDDRDETELNTYIISAYNLGVIALPEDKRFNPTEKLTRAEALLWIDNFVKYQ